MSTLSSSVNPETSGLPTITLLSDSSPNAQELRTALETRGHNIKYISSNYSKPVASFKDKGFTDRVFFGYSEIYTFFRLEPFVPSSPLCTDAERTGLFESVHTLGLVAVCAEDERTSILQAAHDLGVSLKSSTQNQDEKNRDEWNKSPFPRIL